MLILFNMPLLSIFVLLCCTVVCDNSQTCSGDSCKKFQLNNEHFNKRFRGPGLYEMSAPGHHDCVRNCFYLSLCKSTDYYRKDNTCKLNDVDSTQIATSDFEKQNGAVFSDITAWPSAMAGKCGLRPCSKRQRCIPDKDTFHCADIYTATVLCDMGFSSNQTTVQCNILEKWEKAVCVKECSPGVWINLRSSQIQIQIQTLSHSEAIKVCESTGAELVKIDEPWKMDVIAALLQNCPEQYWVDGSKDPTSVDAWTFSDGTSVPMDKYFWKNHAPNGGEEHACFRMVQYNADNIGDYRFDDTTCDQMYRFICEKTMH